MESVAVVAILLAIGALAVVREIRARRALARLRERLAQAEASLIERNEIAQVGQVVSDLAHELNSPLQGLLGNTEVMLATGQESQNAEELQDIHQSATRAAGIVRNLIAFADTTALARRWQDVNEIVRHAVEASRGELEAAGVEVTVRTERLPVVYVDGRQLEKVLSSLLARARETAAAASALGGARADRIHVTVTTGRRASPDERLVVEVVDDGPPSEGDRAASSGLSASVRVVEAHGGSMAFEKRTIGARVTIELPISAAAGAPSSTVSEAAKSPVGVAAKPAKLHS